MDHIVSLSSPLGDFDLTPDRDCRMVYVDSHHDNSVPTVKPKEIPEWFFDPETIWFYFGAPGSEDKATAGNKIKVRVLEDRDNF